MDSTNNDSQFPAGRKKAVLALAEAQTGVRWAIPERRFYWGDAVAVTRRLLGCLLLHAASHPKTHELTLAGGRIVEAEAYLGEHDPAAHAARGLTPVTQILYHPGGLAYVFMIYGVYYCLNAVARPKGKPGCVLIRALEPLIGIEAMAARRKAAPTRLKDLCSGPGKLCQALGIGSRHNGCDLTVGPLLILRPRRRPGPVASGPRVGITKAADWPLRFWLAGSPWVSK